MKEQVVIVNKDDEVIGVMGKLEAHQKGELHQAISIVVFNKTGQMLIQQRARCKYHWANIWSNTVCTHPRPQETHQAAADRRLIEELGFSTKLEKVFSFIYKATDSSSGLIEHEYDHVFIGYYDGQIPFNETEVQNVQWIDIPELLEDIEINPQKYSFWFKIILQELQNRKIID